METSCWHVLADGLVDVMRSSLLTVVTALVGEKTKSDGPGTPHEARNASDLGFAVVSDKFLPTSSTCSAFESGDYVWASLPEWDKKAAFVAAVTGFIGFLLLYFIHVIFVQPINRILLHHTVGYDHLEELFGKKTSSKERAFLVNWMNRRKVLGDLPPVYPNGWFAILESDSLPKQAVRHVQVLGENFAVFRSEGGEVHILDAYCPHLGANLAVGGKVRGDCLECPFHGWVFDGHAGKCVSIPYSASKPPPQAKVKSWPCRERMGLIFVWYHAENVDPFWEPPEVEEISKNLMAYCGRSEHYISTHIQDMPENGADVAHLNVLHTAGMPAGPDLRKVETWWGTFLKHYWSATWNQGDPSHISNIQVLHKGTLFNWNAPFLDMSADINQIGPGLVILEFKSLLGLGRALLVQTVTPVEPLLQKVVHRFYFSNRILKVFGKLSLLLENIMVERDIAVWNSKKFMKNPILVKEDKLILTYRRWYSQYYSENSPTMESLSKKASLDW